MGKRQRLFAFGIPIASALALFFILQMLMRLPEERIFVPDGTAPIVTDSDLLTVRIGVVSRYSPSMIYQGYQPVMDFLSANTDYRFELRLYPTYRETVERLVDGEIDAAFLGSLVYVETRDRFPVVPILRPLNDKGEPTQQAVIITRANGGQFQNSDLSGARVAVPSDQSFAATWFERIYLPSCAEALEVQPTIEHFNYHPTVVFQVLRGAVTFGVVKDRIAADYTESGIRIVGHSPVIPSSPLVVRRDADPVFVDQLSQALIEVTRSGHGSRDISTWDIEFAYGFERTNERDYDELASLSARMVRR